MLLLQGRGCGARFYSHLRQMEFTCGVAAVVFLCSLRVKVCAFEIVKGQGLEPLSPRLYV